MRRKRVTIEIEYSCLGTRYIAKIVYVDGSMWYSDTQDTRNKAVGILRAKMAREDRAYERNLYGSRK